MNEMYNLKISENDLCSLITYVGRHLIERLEVSYITKDDFGIVKDDFELLSYLLKVFRYDGDIFTYLHYVGLDDEYINSLEEIVDMAYLKDN